MPAATAPDRPPSALSRWSRRTASVRGRSRLAADDLGCRRSSRRRTEPRQPMVERGLQPAQEFRDVAALVEGGHHDGDVPGRHQGRWCVGG
jgi:hypothetical protein